LRRSPLSDVLSRELGGDFVVVPGPDHPELISGPDVLIGGRGRITALFRISRSTQVRLLRARLIGARLALPAGSSLVAHVESGVEPPRNLVENAFDVVLSENALADLVGVCRARETRNRASNDLQRVQYEHSIYYSTVLQIARLRQRREARPTSPSQVIASLRSRHVGETQTSFRESVPIREEEDLVEAEPWPSPRRGTFDRLLQATVEGTTVAALPESTVERVMRAVRPIWSAALSADFTFDNGVPYQRAFNPRVLLVEAWPTHRGDPTKPVRALAFAGWLPAIATTADEIASLVRRTLEVTARRLRA
jgi:hypothetical protein